MATNDIGRVTPIWRGFYSAATTYELNDIVIDTAGSVWWHKSEELTTGVAPTAGEIWDAVIDMSVFSGLIQAAITTAQTALAAAQEAVAEVTADTERAETAAENAETSALSASESAASVGAYAQAAEQAKNAAQTAASQAAASASSAGTSAASAGSSAQAAEASKTAAQTAASQAAGSAETASGAAAVVEQKKTEALAAIEAKGEEVLESIPEDYTELSGDVGDLKTQSTPEDYSNPINPTIVKGDYISTVNGKKGSNTPTRARTNIIDGYDKILGVCMDSDTYKYRLFYYGANGDLSTGAGFISATVFGNGFTKIPSTAVKIAMDFCRYDNANISDADVTAIKAVLFSMPPIVADIRTFNEILTDTKKTYLTLQYGLFSNSKNAFKPYSASSNDRAYCVYQASEGDVINCENSKAIQVTEINADYTAVGNITSDYVSQFVFPRDVFCIITSKNLLDNTDWGTVAQLTTSVSVSCKAETKEKTSREKRDEYDSFGEVSMRNTDFTNLTNLAKSAEKYRINYTTGEAQFVDETGWYASDYTAVEAGGKYTLNFSYYSSAYLGIAFYDSNKAYVTGMPQSNYHGTHGDTAAASANFTFTVPEGCSYCRFTIAENIKRQALCRLTHYIPDLVNQDGIPASEWISYAGEKVSIGNKYCVNKYMNMTHSIGSGQSNQGGDCYGDYYFQFEHEMKYVHVYNMATRKFVQTIQPTAVTDLHCNCVSFGVEKYDADDYFPLIYASAGLNEKTCVFRISGDVGEWTMTQVQTISWDNSLYHPVMSIDRENRWLIQIAYTLQSAEQTYGGELNHISIKVFDLPTLAEGDVNIDESDAIYSSVTPWKKYYQDNICRCGKLYQEYGNSYTDLFLTVYDVTTGTILSDIDLRQSAAPSIMGTNPEPEGLFEYNSDLFIAGYKYGNSAPSQGNNAIIQLKFL